MFLTQSEIEELTGFVCPSKQIAWLARNGIKFLVSATGHPKVLISHLQEIMMNNSGAKKRTSEPNFAALHEKKEENCNE